MQAIGVVGDHVRGEGAGLDRPGVGRVRFADRAEHDPAAWRPTELRVLHPVTVAVHDNLLEAERVDEKPDEGPGIPGPQRGPHLRWGCLVGHDTEHARTARGPAWTFRNSFGQPPRAARQRAEIPGQMGLS